MAIKVENQSSTPIPHLEEQVKSALDCLPVEHLRGFSRIVFVDRIEEPRLEKSVTETLPLLYRPKQPGTASAFGEVALAILQQRDASFLKRLQAKAQFKAQIAQCVLALAAQHHLVTLSSRKKTGGGVERAVRNYVEKYFVVWRDRQTGFRARLFKPLIPYLEKWGKTARKYAAEQAKKKAAQ